jgi:hypothetical protein
LEEQSIGERLLELCDMQQKALYRSHIPSHTSYVPATRDPTIFTMCNKKAFSKLGIRLHVTSLGQARIAEDKYLEILWLVGHHGYEDNSLKIVDILKEFSQDSKYPTSYIVSR